MLIYIGADHRGFKLKESLKNFLSAANYQAVDLGNDHYDENDDYPDFAAKVAEKIDGDASGESRGIVICGSGAGVSIVANKFKGARCVTAISPEQAAATRKDEDTNILALAADFLSEEVAKNIAKIWLETPFSGEERHKRRLAKIKEIEQKR
ncbi:RpiB/LacA/LacB family sugar-phosphate isomerase [Candidatus Wolfebacteria bacterium]|nr:RpiB/LacA/LacB family sugar-phosphate isomerase [Candidatus Wolfebacteria bacterium]